MTSMVPHSVDCRKSRDAIHLVNKLGNNPTEVDDGNVEVLRVKMEEGNGNFEGFLEDKVVEEIVLPLPVFEDETRQVISNMLDCEEVFGESNVVVVKVTLMVEHDGHQIFKDTLVPQFNANLFLSKDRLMQVMYFNNNDETSTPPPHLLPCWSDWDLMWASLLCLEIQLEFF